MDTTSTKLTNCSIRTSRLLTGRWLGAVMITGLFMLVSGGPARGQSRELRDLSAQLAQRITSSGKKRVAVADFTDLQGNVTELGRFLAEQLSVSLAQQANGFTVIDRTYLKAILREHKLASTGLIDPATASKLGEIAGVQALITGTTVPLGDNVSLSVKVLDASTEAIIAATMTQIPRTEAINALLKTGISAGAAGSGPAASSESGHFGPQEEPSKPPSPRTVTVRQGDLLLVMRGCHRGPGQVVCSGVVTDEGSSALAFPFGGGYVLDNLGNQYDLDKVTVGRSSPENQPIGRGRFGNSMQTLEPQLPLNFSVSANNVEQAATSVSIVLNPGRFLRFGKPVIFRHIPIQGR